MPTQASQPSTTIIEPVLELKRSTTLPTTVPTPLGTGRSLLAPEDAIYQGSPPRRQSAAVNRIQKDLRMTSGTAGNARLPSRGRTHKEGGQSGSRRRNRVWKKLLWVKQSCKFEKLLWVEQPCELLMSSEIRNADTLRRPGQLYRPRYLSRTSPAKPPPPAIPLLASCRRLYSHSAARMLSHNIHRLLCRDLPGTCIS